jgi:hypothetical protein
MADAHGLAGGGGSSARGRTASGKLCLPNGAPSPSRQSALAATNDRRSGCTGLAELQLPHAAGYLIHKIRPYSGPQGWTWGLGGIEPEVGPEQSKFADVTNVVGRLQQKFDLDLSPRPPA